MFGSKKKKAQAGSRRIIAVLDGEVLFDGDILDLPIREEIILQKSDEFFNDKTPCFIHRGAVISRLLEEIWNAVETYGEIRSDYIDFPSGTVLGKVGLHYGGI